MADLYQTAGRGLCSDYSDPVARLIQAVRAIPSMCKKLENRTTKVAVEATNSMPVYHLPPSRRLC